MLKQHTIKNVVYVDGVGLHSGLPVHMTLKPARANTGIIFQRTDANYPPVNVGVDNVQEAPLCTELVDGENRIATIEHLLAALAGLAIDNIIVELDAPEVPVLDGSAEQFTFLLQSAGIKPQQASRHIIDVKKKIRIKDGDRFVELSPYNGLRFELSIDFTHPAIRKTPQSVSFDLNPVAFVRTVSRARTFGFAKDLDYLHKHQRALGASLKNAVGIDDKGVMNPEGLRFPDEFVRHKLLDAIGDLYVAGPIKGLYRAHKPSHSLNHQLLQKLLAKKPVKAKKTAKKSK